MVCSRRSCIACSNKKNTCLPEAMEGLSWRYIAACHALHTSMFLMSGLQCSYAHAAVQVLITQREQQGNTVTCRCKVLSDSDAVKSVIALFRCDMAVETTVGSTITICSPWRECTLAGKLHPFLTCW